MSVGNTVLSDVEKKGGSEKALISALENSNEYASGLDRKDVPSVKEKARQFKVKK